MRLTYLGPSGRFRDPVTGKVWERGGTHEVSQADVARLTEKPEPEVVPGAMPKPEEQPSRFLAQWHVEQEPKPMPRPQPEPEPEGG